MRYLDKAQSRIKDFEMLTWSCRMGISVTVTQEEGVYDFPSARLIVVLTSSCLPLPFAFSAIAFSVFYQLLDEFSHDSQYKSIERL